MKILSFVTHTPHAYDLVNALWDSQFTMISPEWNRQQRPVPSNVAFENPIRELQNSVKNRFDLAIAHVGGETEAIIPEYFKDLPLILISHGMGEPYMTSDTRPLNYNPYKIAASCKNYRVVCCNEKEAAYWSSMGMKNSTWIWHGMKEEFGQSQYTQKLSIIVNSGGWEYMNNVPLLTDLHNRGVDWLQKDYQIEDFYHYTNMLQTFNIYISGTRYSSFPRSRAEAMHTGMCVLTTNNWDEDKFIEDGVNGFFINDNPDDIMALVNSLTLDTIKRVGLVGRETARKYFGLEAYRKRWLEEIDYAINKS